MSQKNYAEVLIDGVVYTLGGTEDEAYLRRVAAYLNEKIGTIKKQRGFSRQNADYQNLMIHLNIADDYFKAKKQISILEEELQGKEKELYDLKHELISAQIKLENAEKQGKELQKQLNEDAKKIVRLETELKDK